MLVIGRNKDERLLIGTDIRVTLIHQHGRWKIGVEAPTEVKILREEVAPPELVASFNDRYGVLGNNGR